MAGDESSNRLLALRAAYQSAEGRLGISEEEFIERLSGWEVHPVGNVGAVLIKGEEIHACIKPEGFGRWISKRLIRETLGRVLERHGRAITKVTTEAGETFVRRLGFQKKEEQGIEIWELKLQSEPD